MSKLSDYMKSVANTVSKHLSPLAEQVAAKADDFINSAMDKAEGGIDQKQTEITTEYQQEQSNANADDILKQLGEVKTIAIVEEEKEPEVNIDIDDLDDLF